MIFHICCDVASQLLPPWQSVTIKEEHQPGAADLFSRVTDGKCLFILHFFEKKKKEEKGGKIYGSWSSQCGGIKSAEDGYDVPSF